MNQVTVGITGASGAIYALRTVRALMICGFQIDLIVSEFGWMLLRDEGGFEGKKKDLPEFLVRCYGDVVRNGSITMHNSENMAATVASGSVGSNGMVVVPCSMKYVSSIAIGASTNLIERAADVALKEKRPLVLVPRETPFNLVHLRNLTAAAEAGASILPAMPAFYQNPVSFDDLADFIAGRVLSQLGIAHDLYPPWEGS
ncbi:MAG TPA: aromatic acid decarboxylase [Candidatus Latescibacteria bacterium]|nr:aromatic acid decarboxylase [Gemmatimonadota bacterium]HCR17890.1 aromatic acid decarboxylase [Candidatus Latescibacterota bacterium]|tara:strand:+ start:960 stop:1562 length:603 start_codon:yes stop_codon:yes gene_type:complete